MGESVPPSLPTWERAWVGSFATRAAEPRRCEAELRPSVRSQVQLGTEKMAPLSDRDSAAPLQKAHRCSVLAKTSADEPGRSEGVASMTVVEVGRGLGVASVTDNEAGRRLRVGSVTVVEAGRSLGVASMTDNGASRCSGSAR